MLAVVIGIEVNSAEGTLGLRRECPCEVALLVPQAACGGVDATGCMAWWERVKRRRALGLDVLWEFVKVFPAEGSSVRL